MIVSLTYINGVYVDYDLWYYDEYKNVVMVVQFTSGWTIFNVYIFRSIH
jgi:hypothetical protein